MGGFCPEITIIAFSPRDEYEFIFNIYNAMYILKSSSHLTDQVRFYAKNMNAIWRTYFPVLQNKKYTLRRYQRISVHQSQWPLLLSQNR